MRRRLPTSIFLHPRVRRGLHRSCELCARPAQAYAHPNPLRTNVTLYRCRWHARLRFCPVDEKQGLGGGVYR